MMIYMYIGWIFGLDNCKKIFFFSDMLACFAFTHSQFYQSSFSLVSSMSLHSHSLDRASPMYLTHVVERKTSRSNSQSSRSSSNLQSEIRVEVFFLETPGITVES